MSMSIEMILLIVGILICSILLIVPSSAEKKVDSEVDDRKRGEVLTSWFSRNKMPLTLKLTIVTILILVISPRFTTIVSSPHLYNKTVESFMLFINSISVKIKPFNTWTNDELLFIIGYMTMLIIVVNIPIHYVVLTNGISHRVLGIEIRFHPWEKIICFDVNGNSQTMLMFWFDPAKSKPDWRVSIPRSSVPSTSDILQDFIFRYNVEKHKVKESKVFTRN